MNKPLFSVIVPVYNIEKYVRECIESVLTQNFNDLELILVDDGSNDNNGKICDEYAILEGRVIVVHKENGGLVSARKSGANLARGRYVVALDGVDSIHLRIKLLNYSDVDLKNTMVLLAIKHKMWRVFWLFYHRSK